MIDDKLAQEVKDEEDRNFSSGGKVYIDTEGFDTIGYGTKLPLSEAECDALMRMRLKPTVDQVDVYFNYLKIDDVAWNILYGMAYQMGITGLSKFKNMLIALQEQDYQTAASEMRDSRWYNQTKNRAERLASRMEGIV